MRTANIAIVGLEGAGEQLLEWLIGCGDHGPDIVCAVALQDGAGRQRADANGIALVDIDRLVQLSDKIDIIFDMAGDAAMHEALHHALIAFDNHHTQLLSERAMPLIGILLATPPEVRAA